MTRLKIFTWLVSLTVWEASWAKGLDELSSEPTPPDPASEAAQVEAGKTAPTPPPEPSEFSKSIANKLFLTTGISYTKIEADKGAWTAGLASDVGIAYRFSEAFLGGQGLASFRYAPSDVVVLSEGDSYRGVIETYHFGGIWILPVTEALSYVASCELGLVQISLESHDGMEEDSDLESGVVQLTFGGGADWQVLEKVKVGPRVYLGAGSQVAAQAAGMVTFIF